MLTEPNSAASRIAHHGRNVKENDNSATENLQIFFIIRQVWTAGLFFRRDFARNAVDKEDFRRPSRPARPAQSGYRYPPDPTADSPA